MKAFKFAFVVNLIILIPALVFADIADDAWNAYQTGDFRRVEMLAQISISDTTLAPERRAFLFFAVGCSNAMQGRDIAARDAFKQAFRLNPNIRYDAVELPPPVWKLFKPVQDSVSTLSIAQPTKTVEAPATAKIDTVRIVRQISVSKGAVSRSLAYPGWGHLYQNDKRGYKFLIGETILLAGFFYSLDLTDRAKNDYLAARTGSDVTKYYDQYNNYYKLSWGLGTAAVGFYLFTQWEFFSNPPGLSLQSDFTDRIELALQFTL